MSDHQPPLEHESRRRELRSYVLGFAFAALLTGGAFALVAMHDLPRSDTLVAIAVLALLQTIVHFHFFLHIDLKKSHRDDLQLILFTCLIVALMVGGTVWILASQFNRM